MKSQSRSSKQRFLCVMCRKKKFQGYQTKTNVSYLIKKRGGGEEQVTLENNTCSAQCIQCMFELCEGLRPVSLQTTLASYNSRAGAKHWENCFFYSSHQKLLTVVWNCQGRGGGGGEVTYGLRERREGGWYGMRMQRVDSDGGR